MIVNRVIVQFQLSEKYDLDRLYLIESTLDQAFSQNDFAIVDGNDVGMQSGKFNIYIYPTRAWAPVLERVKAFLKLRGALDDAIIVKSHGKSGRDEVIHPKGHTAPFGL